MNARRLQLTGAQERRVQDAREVAVASAKEIAGDYTHAQRYPEAYALGVAQATIRHLRQARADLAGEPQ